MTILATFDNS